MSLYYHSVTTVTLFISEGLLVISYYQCYLNLDNVTSLTSISEFPRSYIVC